MSRQRPKQLAQGSRRWWSRTMRDWALSMGRSVPKNERRSMRGAAKAGLYAPRWGHARQPYEMTYEQKTALLMRQEDAE